MIVLPLTLLNAFDQLLIGKSLPNNIRVNYIKWLRFYWDFCHKYHHNPSEPHSLPLFLRKLQDKHQTEEQQQQAQQAIIVFYGLQAIYQDPNAHWQVDDALPKGTGQVREPMINQPYRSCFRQVTPQARNQNPQFPPKSDANNQVATNPHAFNGNSNQKCHNAGRNGVL